MGGIVSVAQLGAVSPTFGYQREFAAIAAAVLGGTSLFGGRGNVLPGTIMGAVLIQTVENGLVIINANPYVYPVVTGGHHLPGGTARSHSLVASRKVACPPTRVIGNHLSQKRKTLPQINIVGDLVHT